MRRAEVLVLALAGLASGVTAQVAPAPAAVPAPVNVPLPAARWTLDQIRQAFALADADANGQLSRAEAQRLPLMPRSFEDTDENKDGAIVLREYESSFRQ